MNCFSRCVNAWQKWAAFFRMTTLAARSVASRSGISERKKSNALRRSTRRWRSMLLCCDRFSHESSESEPVRDDRFRGEHEPGLSLLLRGRLLVPLLLQLVWLPLVLSFAWLLLLLLLLTDATLLLEHLSDDLANSGLRVDCCCCCCCCCCTCWSVCLRCWAAVATANCSCWRISADGWEGSAFRISTAVVEEDTPELAAVTAPQQTQLVELGSDSSTFFAATVSSV